MCLLVTFAMTNSMANCMATNSMANCMAVAIDYNYCYD